MRTKIALRQLEIAASVGCYYLYTLALADLANAAGADYSDKMREYARTKQQAADQKRIEEQERLYIDALNQMHHRKLEWR